MTGTDHTTNTRQDAARRAWLGEQDDGHETEGSAVPTSRAQRREHHDHVSRARVVTSQQAPAGTVAYGDDAPDDAQTASREQARLARRLFARVLRKNAAGPRPADQVPGDKAAHDAAARTAAAGASEPDATDTPHDTDGDNADVALSKAQRKAAAKKAKDAARLEGWEGLEPYQPQGALARPKSGVARRGGYAPVAPGAPSTTKQAQILNTSILAAPTGAEGIAIGRDKLTNSMVAHDPFTAYSKKIITSPGVIVLGVIGSGKSSLLKTVYVLRPLTFAKRRCVVIDRKDQEGQGEYTAVTRKFDGGLFRMLIGRPDEGTILNPLDDNILAVIGVHGTRGLLRGMAERARPTFTPLDEWEDEALRIAHTLVRRRFEGASIRQATMSDLIDLLGVMDRSVTGDLTTDMSKKARERLHQAGMGVKFLLRKTIDEELDGLFNGETSSNVNLDSKLTTFDISQLPEDGPAAGMVMAVAQATVMGKIRHDRGWGTNFVVEEGWDMVSGPIGRSMKTNQLLARGLGLSMVVAMHHIRQVSADSNARELLQEPQTVHLYRQDREEDVQACIENFGLDPSSAEALRSQDAGSHLLKIGSLPEIAVQHVRSSWEAAITNTDNAMHLGGA